MTKEEYQKAMQKIEENAEKKRIAAKKEYAMSNNPYSIGDILEDHHQKIRVENIKVSHCYNEFPECVYIGPRLKKDNTEYKSGTMWQSNVKNKIRD